jgi:hypothetical protein
MAIQHLKIIFIVLILVSLFVASIVWLHKVNKRMQLECEIMGGKFYAISLTQNVCVNGEEVEKLN